MAPISPAATNAWQGHVSRMQKDPRYQEFIGPYRSLTVSFEDKSKNPPVKWDETINYRQLSLDASDYQQPTYIRIMNDNKGQPAPEMMTLKYTTETIGSAPTGSKYPLVLALHGGGRAASTLNDQQWRNMTIFYKGSLAAALPCCKYVALRGIGNDWDLHFTSASYMLIERLIENFVMFDNVDPDQVYLLGFSAGGDGVFRIATQLAQRFRAVNAGGGHPGDPIDSAHPAGFSFLNLGAVPICMQVGEYDSAYGRCQAVAQAALHIDKIKFDYYFADSAPLTPGGPPVPNPMYQKQVFIHQPDNPADFNKADPNDKYDARHFGWESSNANCTPQNYPNRDLKLVVKDYKVWAANYTTGVPSKDTAKVDTNAIAWMLSHKGPRLFPDHIVWNLKDSQNAVWENLSGRGRVGQGRRQHYWLDVGQATPDEVGPIIEVKIDRVKNVIDVIQAKNRLRILLTPSMFDDPTKSVKINMTHGPFTATTKRKIEWDNLKIIEETLYRNDPTLIFTAAINIRDYGNGFVVEDD